MIYRLLVTLIVLLAVSPARAEVKTLAEWAFDRDSMGWTAGTGIEGLGVREGCLVGRAVARDPLIHGPMIEIPAKPNQFVEIRMKCSADGSGELFWANTTEPPYEGFRPEQVRRIQYKTGEFHIYRIFPFWQAQKKIIRLRLDPPENAEFAIDYIRVVEIVSSETGRAFFDFTNGDQGWFVIAEPPTGSDASISRGTEMLLLSPGLDLDAAAYPWLSLSARASAPSQVVLQWVTDDLSGVRSHTIALKGDGRDHVYNVPTEEIPDWSGRISMFAVKVPAVARVHAVGATAEPTGPAEFDIRRFGPLNPINRTGRHVVVQATVVNTGGEAARGIKVVLHTPLSLPAIASYDLSGRKAGDRPAQIERRSPGAPVLDKVVRTIPELRPGESATVEWTVSARGVGEFKASVDAIAPGAARTSADGTFHWYPAVNVGKASYVPEPQPVRGEMEVGVYYYPGWPTYTRWSVLDDFPERRPLLGYYREGEPEVADWHIKWMVEHGITFIVYDWYWSAGGRHLEHAIHQGFFNARYHDMIKFCLLWANHNAPGTSTAEDMVNVTNYWLDNYFLRDDYMKVDGKPVVVIFSAHRLTEDLGVEGVRAAFDRSREMAKARGLNGIYFVACSYPGRGGLETLEREGYDAVSGYNYPSAGDGGQMVAPYADNVTGYREFWHAIQDNTSLPYIPVTDPGWDSRPWHGPNARVRTGKTPGLFRQMLLNAREFVEKRKVAGPKMVLIEAWNEFGEGDYLEPHREWGFGHVDAVREVFTDAPKEHVDLVPQDVGLGPYEFEKPVPRTAWEFDDPSHPGWDASQNLTNGRVENGCLVAESTGIDPAIYGEATEVDSKRFRTAEIRMKVDKGREAQLFWAGRARGFTEPSSLRYEIVADGEWRVYRLNLGASPAWKGRIGAFRLDPCDARGARVEVDYIRLVP